MFYTYISKLWPLLSSKNYIPLQFIKSNNSILLLIIKVPFIPLLSYTKAIHRDSSLKKASKDCFVTIRCIYYGTPFIVNTL